MFVITMLSLFVGCKDNPLAKGDLSYCEALCDWAVECAAVERDLDGLWFEAKVSAVNSALSYDIEA